MNQINGNRQPKTCARVSGIQTLTFLQNRFVEIRINTGPIVLNRQNDGLVSFFCGGSHPSFTPGQCIVQKIAHDFFEILPIDGHE